MIRAIRLVVPSVLTLAALSACTDKKADTGAAMDSSMTAVAPATISEAPAELKAQSDKMIAGWNQEDPAVPMSVFTADATVHQDTLAFIGADNILNQWVKPGLPVISNLSVSNQVFSGTADAMTETGNFTETVTVPKKPAATNAGTYTATWVKAGPEWKVKDLTIKSSAPATGM